MVSVATCACSVPLSPSPTTAPISQNSSQDNILRTHSHQTQNPRVSSTPASPSASLITVTDPGSNRVSKNAKKRKSISINAEAALELANMQNSIETIALERVTVSSVGGSVNTNGTHTRTGNVYVPQVHGKGNSSTEGNEATTVQEPQVVAPTNATFWEQQVWDQQSNSLNDQQPGLQPSGLNENFHTPPPQSVHPRHPGPCCGGCGSNPTIFEPKSQPNPVLTQSYFHNSHPFRITHPSTFAPILNQPMQHMQPIATTIYTYPNGYTTVNNPLTPQELQMLQATGAWYPSAGASWSGLNTEGVRADISTGHACSCGPTCECLGCVAHPFNSSTVNFVRNIRNMQSSRHGIHGSSRQSGSCCGRERQPRDVVHSPSGANSGPLSMGYGVMHNQKLAHRSISPPTQQQHVPSTPHFHQIQICTPPQLQGVEPSSSPLLHQDESSPTNGSPKPQYLYHPVPDFSPDLSSPTNIGSSSDPVNSEEDVESEQNVVSPSAYFHIDYPLGQCSGSNISCPCGEDCVCIGCLVHGNSMPMTGAAANEQDEVEHIVKAVGESRSPKSI